jgi:malonyl-CoA decarboxylase
MGCLAALIDVRAKLLEGLRQHPEWSGMEAERAELLKLLLNNESLHLVRIDRHSPREVLDRIIKSEAVHPIRDARDLHRRLAEDRRCFAFFHPALAGEPLIFTELALTHDMSANIDALLDPDSPILDPATCRCAMFYSISSCHEGLYGVPLGNALIGRVADELARVLPALDVFATLSPVPGFRAWLTKFAAAAPDGPTQTASALATLQQPDWHADGKITSDLARPLVSLCAYYLLRVKRGDEPADDVARFHLRNGARLERINWLSDTSETGLRRSAGMMVNYLYRSRRAHDGYDASMRPSWPNVSYDIERLAGTEGAL